MLTQCDVLLTCLVAACRDCRRISPAFLPGFSREENAMQLFEKYRPRAFDDVVGQDKAVAVLRRLERSGGLAGRAYFVSGASGTGKSTLGRIIAGMVGDE